MARITIVFLFLLFQGIARADFADIATIRINNQLVRNVMLSNQPYLVCLSKYQPNDTLTISVKTDYGGERSAYLSCENVATKERYKFDVNQYILLTDEMINEPHIFSVNYVNVWHEPAKESTWNIFETTNDERVEQMYEALNGFAVSLARDFGDLRTYLADSIKCNFSLLDGVCSKSDTISFLNNQIDIFLQLNDQEKDYFQSFNAIDYFTVYNGKNKLYGRILMDRKDLKWITLRLSYNYKPWFQFHFVFEQGGYKLKAIFV